MNTGSVVYLLCWKEAVTRALCCWSDPAQLANMSKLNTYYHIHLKLPVARQWQIQGQAIYLSDWWIVEKPKFNTINLVALKLKTLQWKDHLQLLSCKLCFMVSFNHGQIVSKLCTFMTTARFKNIVETKGQWPERMEVLASAVNTSLTPCSENFWICLWLGIFQR